MNILWTSYFNRYFDNLLVGLKYNPAIINILNKQGQKSFITCSGKNDGAGAQALAIMSTILFARDLGLTYIHTPFSQIAHNTDNDPDWEEKWEKFFGLGKEEIHIEEVKNSGIEIIDLTELSKISFYQANIGYSVTQCHKYANLFPNRYEKITDVLRSKYIFGNKTNYRLNRSPRRINIAIHIRRGDINSSGINSIRYTQNDYISTILDQIVDYLSKLGFDAFISIYSQGEKDDFGELQNLDIQFNLDQCVFTTFNNLVNADILVMSKSTLSYTAALLSDGIKIYEPFYHKPLKCWLPVNKNAGISEEKFRSTFHRKFDSLRCL